MNNRQTINARDKIARLSSQGLDLASFWQASGEVLADAVPDW